MSLQSFFILNAFHQFDLECLNKFFDADHLVQSWQSDRNCSASALRRTFTAIDQILLLVRRAVIYFLAPPNHLLLHFKVLSATMDEKETTGREISSVDIKFGQI